MLVDDSANTSVRQLGDALTELEVNSHFFGSCSLTLVLHGTDARAVQQQTAEATKAMAVHDGSVFEETYNLPMHDLARALLGPRAARVAFLQRSFKDPDWPQGLGLFDAVITNQSVHELRHKRHAPRLHAAAVRQVLRPGGVYLVTDGFFGTGGLQNDQLHMTVAEQQAALLAAGFSQVELVTTSGSLAMHRAT